MGIECLGADAVNTTGKESAVSEDFGPVLHWWGVVAIGCYDAASAGGFAMAS